MPIVKYKPRSLRRLMEWREFRRRLEDLDERLVRRMIDEQIEELEDACNQEHGEAYKPLARADRSRLEGAEDEDEQREILTLLALRNGVLVAFVANPTHDVAFEILPHVWTVPEGIIDWDAVYELSCFSIPDGFTPQSPEAEYRNRPLFVDETKAKQWLQIRPPSNAKIANAAAIIIERWNETNHPNSMKRSEFIHRLMETVIGLTENRAEKAWREHAPEVWKKPGRRPVG